MTLMETKVVLEDGISVGGKELREIYEVVNHKKVYQYVKKCIAEGKILDEPIVKDIHAILTENIIVGGIYRNQEVRISGAAVSYTHLPCRIRFMYRFMSEGHAGRIWDIWGMIRENRSQR